jgi:hypothetical protein
VGFSCSSRDELSIEVAAELFAVSDEQFLRMFVAPGAIAIMYGLYSS